MPPFRETQFLFLWEIPFWKKSLYLGEQTEIVVEDIMAFFLLKTCIHLFVHIDF